MRLSQMVADLPEGQLFSPGFSTFYIDDRNNLSGQSKRRLIEQPNAAMRLVHKRLRQVLRCHVDDLPYATGAIKGWSPLRNVQAHGDNQYFFLTDIHGAYEQVDMSRLAEVLFQLIPDLADDAAEVETFLRRYCQSERGGLATGAPASTDLYNLYAAVLLDQPLSTYCAERGITYTRYLDDLTFSSKVPFGKTKRPAMLEIISAAGFGVSDRKTQVLDLAKGAIVINGIGLAPNGRVFLPRWFLREIDALLNRALKYGDVLPGRVTGMIGVFWSVVGGTQCLRHLELNQVEIKVARKISLWQERQQRIRNLRPLQRAG